MKSSVLQRTSAAVIAAGIALYFAGCGGGSPDAQDASQMAGAKGASDYFNVGEQEPPNSESDAVKAVALPACELHREGGQDFYSSTAQAMPAVGAAMSAWVAQRCAVGWRGVPADVTCRMRANVGNAQYRSVGWELPTAGDGSPFRVSPYTRRLREVLRFYNQQGDLLGTATLDAAPLPADRYPTHVCDAHCGGSAASTLATAVAIRGESPFAPPGEIPSAGENPAGQSFCVELQNQLLARGADCRVAAAHWSVTLTATPATPWERTGETGQFRGDRACSDAERATYPGCHRMEYVFDWEEWRANETTLQANCERELNAVAPTQADRDGLCRQHIPEQGAEFRTQVPAAVCAAGR